MRAVNVCVVLLTIFCVSVQFRRCRQTHDQKKNDSYSYRRSIWVLIQANTYQIQAKTERVFWLFCCCWIECVLVYVTCWCIFPVIKIGVLYFRHFGFIVGSFNVISSDCFLQPKKKPWAKQMVAVYRWFHEWFHRKIDAEKCNIILWSGGPRVHSVECVSARACVFFGLEGDEINRRLSTIIKLNGFSCSLRA